MAYRNSIEERIFILEKSFQGDAPSVQTAFAERFPGKVPPSRQAIRALKKFFSETGSVRDTKKNGRPVSVRRNSGPILPWKPKHFASSS